MPKDMLKTLAQQMASTNPEHRTSNIAKAMFNELFSCYSRREETQKKFKEILDQLTLYAVIKQYQRGRFIDWDLIVEDIHEAMVAPAPKDDDSTEEDLGAFRAMAI
jgi:flagellar motility protein MotE (MotC chaperone)